ncbi:replication initiation protein [Clostridium septicum]|uniref:replication initiation protein n=1 Tax=Clostridium septicum TaxID=1504 RepID=UPI0008374EF1|nr:replication initiation protein [Clostridium septicum]
MTEEKDLRLVNTPNNIAKGRIEIDAQINKMYYQILNNIQRDNSQLIIKTKKGEQLTQDQEEILKKLDTIQALSCRISKEELFSILQRKNDRTKEEIDRRFNALQSAIFKFTTGEQSSTMVQLIGRVDETADGYIVNLDTKLYKYLFYSLDVGYTPVNLATLFNLTGQYAQALYVLLRSWTGTKREIEFTIEELRKYFKVGEKYKAYKNFKARVIVQAIEEINKTGSMTIEDFKEVKKGRSINSIIFIVNDLEPRVMPIGSKVKETSESISTPVLQAPAPKKLEPVIWLDNIKVANKNIIVALEAMLGDLCYDSPIVRGILNKSFATTIAKDKNGEEMITALNMGLFITIANGEFETNELKAFEGLE